MAKEGPSLLSDKEQKAHEAYRTGVAQHIPQTFFDQAQEIQQQSAQKHDIPEGADFTNHFVFKSGETVMSELHTTRAGAQAELKGLIEREKTVPYGLDLTRQPAEKQRQKKIEQLTQTPIVELEEGQEYKIFGLPHLPIIHGSGDGLH